MNYHRVYDFTEYAREEFSKLEEGVGPENCVECGICEEKCPQNIEII